MTDGEDHPGPIDRSGDLGGVLDGVGDGLVGINRLAGL